jgi:hypothetical protein
MFSFIESMAIEFMLSLLSAVIKNPAKAAALKTQLQNIAQDIASLYGGTITYPSTTLPVTSTSVQRF